MSELEQRDRRRFEDERLKIFSLKVRKIIDGKLKEERKIPQSKQSCKMSNLL